MSWEPVIGLEVHVHLRTATKIFCRCENRFGAEPNSLICPVCLGYPGALPVLNREAVNLAVKLALALGCELQECSVFARKNYFYADLPKGYQISQYDRPIATGGHLPLSRSDRTIDIHRIHLEEDAGKLLHEAPGGAPLPGQSLVDFNRCGVPLVEIVSEPDLRSAAEAQDYLQTLHQLLLYTETSDGNMEEGSLRCDANVSVRPAGAEALGTKAEVKNLNSFRNVARAVEFEIERQIGRLESGQEVVQETRSYDAAQGVTRPMRSKEEAHDYRYFPEPDLPPLIVSRERIESIESDLPEAPWAARARFERDYGLGPTDAAVLSATPQMAGYFEAAVSCHPGNPKGIANWVMTEVLREMKTSESSAEDALSPRKLGALVKLIDDGEISSSAAKDVFTAIWKGTEEPADAVRRLGLAQVRDEEEIRVWVGEVLAEHPEPVAQFLGGKGKAIGFLVGQVMKRSQGRADPQQAQSLLRESLGRLEASVS
jgi:aspartyl-tRNA(Asn)/glutamyl-tRNA(Gln) amidotransferase subunit B